MQRNHRPGDPADVYEYDGLYQLVKVWYGADATEPGSITSHNSLQDYDLDQMGNRLGLTEDSITTDYGPHDGSHLTNVMNQYEEVEGEYIGYDQRGNVLADPNNVYSYDILNRQTSVTNGSGTTEYLYDARGRRIAKIQGITTTHYIYDTSYRIIEERDSGEDLLAVYTYGQGMDEPLTMERDSQTYYYHRDALGSITEVSDDSGDIVERYEYDVYGAVTIFNGSYVTQTASAIGNPYLFTGRQYDPESGNYYYRARVYSPELGRFLSQDPLGFDSGDYNLYRYALNNPTNLTDPTGQFPVLAFLVKASVEALVDGLLQATFNYYFDPNITTAAQAFQSIDLGQVGVAFVTGLLPGGNLVQSVAGAMGDVLLNYLEALENCEEYTPEQAIGDFAKSFTIELIGSFVGDAVVKYGKDAVAAGLRKMGFDDLAEKLLRNADDGPDGPNGPGCPFNSFSAETLVMTEEGLKAISTLVIGDYVLAYNEFTGEIDYYPILATIVNEDQVVQLLTIDGETIVTTPNHPFYTGTGEWVPAGELQIGDTIRNEQWKVGLVEAITFVYDPQPMYNLTVAEAHTYFVGDGQWLVHNCRKAQLDFLTQHFTEDELRTIAFRAEWNHEDVLLYGYGKTAYARELILYAERRGAIGKLGEAILSQMKSPGGGGFHPSVFDALIGLFSD